MLTEALEIIRPLLAGDEITYAGEFFDVANAVLWDRPQSPVPVGVAVSGRDSVDMAARYADVLIATEPKPDLIDAFHQAGGAGKPRYGQLPICYGPDRGACEQTVHDQFRWSGLGWPVNAELPGPRSFAAATASMTPQQASASITCGPDTEQHVAAIRKYVEAGFTHVAVVQVGGDTQQAFLEYAERELLPALRSGATANRSA
jgi:G6PDH family F420-dependent oxidoreductase